MSATNSNPVNNELKLWAVNLKQKEVCPFSKLLSHIGFTGEIESFLEIQRACDELDHIMDVRSFPDIIFLETDFHHDMVFYFLEKLKRRRPIVNNSTRVVVLATCIDRSLKGIMKNFNFVDHIWKKPISQAHLHQIRLFNSAFIREFSTARQCP